VRYLGTVSGPLVREAMEVGLLDQIVVPCSGGSYVPGVDFCIDNGRFGKGWPGYDRWWAGVQSYPVEGCHFVTAPDHVGDAEATLKDSAPWLPQIRNLGHRAALVAQDGLEVLDTPWDSFDVLFIGGTTEWKLGPEAALLAKEAKSRGKGLHMGRVNSQKRIRYAHSLGCDTVDGTFLAYGPDWNLKVLLRWMLEVL
jgi:hypothetical protein